MSEQGRFVWHEFMTRDADGTAEFFKKVIGYGETSADSPVGPYRMVTLPGTDRPVAGIMPLEEPQFSSEIPPHISGFIGVDDIDSAVAKVRELGGSPHTEIMDAGEVGRFCVIQDPQGIWVNLWQSNEPMDTPTPGAGVFSWSELVTTDVEAGFDFYSKLVGWEIKEDMDMGPSGIYRLFGTPESEGSMGGMMRKGDDSATGTTWRFYITVERIDEALERVKSSGGNVISEPMEVPGGDMIAHCTAPDGIFFALHMHSS